MNEIEEIKEKIDLGRLFAEYVKTVPAGRNFKALCPFHNEKTPSLMINTDKKIWRCFGCGEGGDAFTFLMKMEGIEFKEALQQLAQRAGVTLTQYDSKEDDQKTRLYDICSLAGRYWHKILMDSSRALTVREYIKKRGLTLETVEDFKIGYTIDAWTDTVDFLKKKGFQDEDIFLAGLTIERQSSQSFYDRFRNRLMFPIADLSGRVIGFGGRALDSNDSAKYINSPQTPIYNKSAVLFGLYQAKDAIKKEDLCIIVEGYMDCIPSHQAGVKNVVAISGTALTIDQIKILKRYSNNLAIALDMDAAGQRAATRSIDLALQEEMNVRVITLPQGKDPGECIKNNLADWLGAIKNAQSVMEYFYHQITQNHDITKANGKKEAEAFLLDKLALFGSRVEQDHWLKYIAQKMDISEMVLREDMVKRTKKIETPLKSSIRTKIEAVVKKASLGLPDTRLFKRLLSILWKYPPYFDQLVMQVPMSYWQDEVVANLYKNMVLYYTESRGQFTSLSVDEKSKLDLYDLLNGWFKKKNLILNDESVSLMTESFLLFQKDLGVLSEVELKNELDNIIRILALDYLKRRIDELSRAISEAEMSNDRGKSDQLYLELSEVINQKNLLK
ncbi:MAG: DNA primase [bacterium]